MKLRRSLLHSLLLAVFLTAYAPAQTAPDTHETEGAERALFQTISTQDTVLFTAVNNCDLPKVTSMFDPNVEFYHDKVDPQYGRDTVVTNIKNNLCDKVQRELVPGSLEVYPIHGYGAVEIGIHRFHHIGTEDRNVVGEAKFIHLWRLKDGAWQITRVISYDHGIAKEAGR